MRKQVAQQNNSIKIPTSIQTSNRNTEEPSKTKIKLRIQVNDHDYYSNQLDQRLGSFAEREREKTQFAGNNRQNLAMVNQQGL
jgi:hypothetical protein